MHRALTLAVLTSLLAACAGAPPAETPGGAETAETAPTAEPISTPTPEPRAFADLARSVVQIVALVEEGGDLLPVWGGSGTVISDDGLVLTNAHVVDERYDEWDTLGVLVTEETDELPELRFLAEILAIDYALDLAVIRIVSDTEGDPIGDLGLPVVELGNSDEIEIGDEVAILGYPGIGGGTITFTRGAVSGFSDEHGVEGRAWIKTDATIAGGNSGGLAVDADGRLIGVPTVVGAGSGAEGNYVDCRVLEDTNGDGRITEDDSCIPVGGFINGLRPVNLSLPLVEAAESGEEYVSPVLPPDEIDIDPGFEAAQVSVTNFVLGPDVTEDDRPTEVVQSVPSGSIRICGFWDYEGMSDGVEWDALWYVNGELDETTSFIGDVWAGGETGSWWVCAVNEEEGLVDGVHELVFSVAGEGIAANALFVGDDHPLVEFEIVNESATEICYAQLSPTGAQYWGADDLGPEVTIPAGSSHAVEVAAGVYDILLRDCDLEPIAEEYEVEVRQDTTYTVPGG